VTTSGPSTEPRRPAAALWTLGALFTPFTRVLAPAVLAVSLFFPIEGLGVDLCLLHATTGLPCPGCGMSRALSAISQGQFSAALGLNPFAFFAWLAFAAVTGLAVLPRATRERLEARARASARAAKAYQLVFFAFLGFGLVRFGVFLALGERFP
jgi:hypothetical protein